MTLSKLIMEAQVNPSICPTIGPRLNGLTISDLVIRTMCVNVISLLNKIDDLQIKHDTLGLESYENDFLYSLKEELEEIIKDYPCLKSYKETSYV